LALEDHLLIAKMSVFNTSELAALKSLIWIKREAWNFAGLL